MIVQSRSVPKVMFVMILNITNYDKGQGIFIIHHGVLD